MTALTDLLTKRKPQPRLDSPTAGFTMVEILVVVIMVGILAAISGAGFVGWLDRLRVNAARETVLNQIQTAQLTARQRNAAWRISIRQDGDFVKWAVHSAKIETSKVTWQAIEQKGVKVDTASSTPSGMGTLSNPWHVEFDAKGNTEDEGSRITLSNSVGGNQRCVIIKTSLGAIRSDRDGESCE